MLKVVRKSDPRHSLWLVGDRFRIGQHEDNDLRVSGRGVGDFHAEIVIQGEALTLHSEAGSCFVNNLPVGAEQPLAAGDEVRIGSELLQILDPQQQAELAARALEEAAAARRATSAWVLKAEHPQLKQRRFPLRDGVVIGRAKDSNICIPYKRMSRRHAEFSFVAGQLQVRDLSSANGTFVNDERVETALLKDGDRIRFAQLPFTVQLPVEMEKTQLRPAINVEEILAARRREQQGAAAPPVQDAASESAELALEPAAHMEAAETSAVTASGIDRRLVLLGFAALMALAGAGYWLGF